MALQPLEGIGHGAIRYAVGWRYPTAARIQNTELYYPVIAVEEEVLWEGPTGYSDAWAAHNEAKAVFVEKIKALMALV